MQQLRRHSQVDLGGRDTHVPQVGGQVGQEFLHLGALLVPGRQPVDRETVALMPLAA